MATDRTASADQPTDQDMDSYLAPTWFVDSDAPEIIAFARDAAGTSGDPIERACRLFYAVRDGIRYTAYGLKLDRDAFRASNVLAAGRGWCVTKSCLLAACSRVIGIPCRLGYADVRNHLTTKKLHASMGTDVFYYHGYNEFYLAGKWLKATVAFNEGLCRKARLLPLDFDGRNDSIYHPFDLDGRRHMEYLHDRGQFADVPYEDILATFAAKYPHMAGDAADAQLSGDFEADVEAEAAANPRGPAD